MKKFFLPFAMVFVLVGCSTYQYSARMLSVDKQGVQMTETVVDVLPDYDKVVTETSDYQISSNEAVKAAAYKCIVENDIDVLVDPIVRVESQKNKYRATVTGFAGNYKAAGAGVDAVKEFSKDDIEKYKLLNDPDFARYYYGHGTGDSYFINSSAASEKQEPKTTSLAFAPKMKMQHVDEFYFKKSKRLRDAGIGLTVAGVVTTFVIGVPGICGAYDSGYNYAQDRPNHAGFDAGFAFLLIGPSAVIAGIPMWCVGSRRMKNSNQDMNVSVGSSQSGLGLRLNF